MLKDGCERCHSDPERSEGEESRSGNKGLARFLVVPQGGTPRDDRLDGFFSILLNKNLRRRLANPQGFPAHGEYSRPTERCERARL
jgi:hypothetical protein